MSLSGWIGLAMAKIRLHAVEHRGTTIAKRRRWYAPILIGPGNFYLRSMGARVVVLRDREWKAREIEVYRDVHAIEVKVDPRGWLILPRWPGVVVAGYEGDRLEAVAAAASALQLLPGHGDATLRNVLYDPSTGRATWIDFDTTHDPSMPVIDRRADDLRALLYSAVERLGDVPVSEVFEAVRSGCADSEPWVILRNRLLLGPIHFHPFHLAQANPSLHRRETLDDLIRDSTEFGGICRVSSPSTTETIAGNVGQGIIVRTAVDPTIED